MLGSGSAVKQVLLSVLWFCSWNMSHSSNSPQMLSSGIQWLEGFFYIVVVVIFTVTSHFFICVWAVTWDLVRQVLDICMAQLNPCHEKQVYLNKIKKQKEVYWSCELLAEAGWDPASDWAGGALFDLHPVIRFSQTIQLRVVVCSQPGVWVGVSATDLPELLQDLPMWVFYLLTMFPDDVLHLAFGRRWQVRDELIIPALGVSVGLWHILPRYFSFE